MRCFALGCLLLVVLARPGSAQASSDSVKHRNECRFAEQVMTTGRPEPHCQWARGYIAFCGTESWARAAAAALRRLSTSEDLRTLEKEWARVRLLRDSTLFATATEIANAGSSTAPARVYAIRYLVNIIHPNRLITYDLMVRGTDARGYQRGPCFERTAAGRQAEYHGLPQPRDSRERIAALLQDIHSDPAQPAQVRSAASCLLALPSSATALRAQSTPPTAHDCRVAANKLASNPHSEAYRWALAYGRLAECGDVGARALAGAVQGSSATRDLHLLQEMTLAAPDPAAMEPIVWAATRLRDASVYETALAIVSDPTASVAARVQAIRILSAQLDPQQGGTSASYEYYAGSRITKTGVSVDGLVATADEAVFTGRALPSEALARAEQVVRRVAADPGTPQPVLNAVATLLEEIGGYKLCVAATAAECRQRLEAATEIAGH
jgi:hypothetical protein